MLAVGGGRYAFRVLTCDPINAPPPGVRTRRRATCSPPARGDTPWRTWLSGEEEEPESGEKSHGWVFEVDPFDNRRNVHPTPLTALGRFSHESIAIDPANGILYETEDEDDQVLGLFYRFLPDKPLGGYGSLRAGGRLQAMWMPGVSDLSTVQETGTRFRGVEWVDVPDPLAERTPTRMPYGATPAHSAGDETHFEGVPLREVGMGAVLHGHTVYAVGGSVHREYGRPRNGVEQLCLTGRGGAGTDGLIGHP